MTNIFVSLGSILTRVFVHVNQMIIDQLSANKN